MCLSSSRPIFSNYSTSSKELKLIVLPYGTDTSKPSYGFTLFAEFAKRIRALWAYSLSPPGYVILSLLTYGNNKGIIRKMLK